MAIPLALMAAGTGIQVAGQFMSNFAQASAERQNAEFFKEQAEYARQSARRAEDIAEFDYTAKIGNQNSAYARGGVDISGSAALTIGGTIRNMMEEIMAIRKKGNMESRLAMMRARQSSERSETLGSFQYNALELGGTVVRNWAASELFPEWMKPEAASALAPIGMSGTQTLTFSQAPNLRIS